MIDLHIVKAGKLLGCGCSTFGGSISKKTALQTLDFCYANNIVYYDVARSYGYGQAESILGGFAKDKRENIIITSKFGIEPPRSFPLKTQVMALARMVKNSLPDSKKILGKVAGQVLQKTPFTPAMVLQSLHRSLAELKTDYIDLYLYHESTFDELMNDDICSLLNDAKDKGKIRAWGANPSNEEDQQRLLNTDKSTAVLQVPFALSDTYEQLINRDDQITIIYSVMNLYKSLDVKKMVSLVNIKQKLPQLNFINNYQELFLYLAYGQLKAGAVLMSTTNQSHILRNISIADVGDQSPDTFLKLRQLITNN